MTAAPPPPSSHPSGRSDASSAHARRSRGKAGALSPSISGPTGPKPSPLSSKPLASCPFFLGRFLVLGRNTGPDFRPTWSRARRAGHAVGPVAAGPCGSPAGCDAPPAGAAHLPRDGRLTGDHAARPSAPPSGSSCSRAVVALRPVAARGRPAASNVVGPATVTRAPRRRPGPPSEVGAGRWGRPHVPLAPARRRSCRSSSLRTRVGRRSWSWTPTRTRWPSRHRPTCGGGRHRRPCATRASSLACARRPST